MATGVESAWRRYHDGNNGLLWERGSASNRPRRTRKAVKEMPNKIGTYDHWIRHTIWKPFQDLQALNVSALPMITSEVQRRNEHDGYDDGLPRLYLAPLICNRCSESPTAQDHEIVPVTSVQP